MSDSKTLTFKDSKAALAKPEHYIEVRVDVAKALESWRGSMFSFEWLDGEGRIKSPEALKEKDQARFQDVEAALEAGEVLEKPLLGIGLNDTIEIGSEIGRAHV